MRVLGQNYIMRKVLISILLFLFVFNPAFSKENEKLDVNSSSFLDFGRYIETLEINEAKETNQVEEIQDDSFEEEAILDVAKRYEENAVSLKLDDIDDDALTSINNGRVFKLKINETQYNIENNIKTENMIWDNSKSFSNAFLNDSRHMAPIPGVINSSKITADVSNSLSASLGQTYLNDANGTSLLFVRTNESTYNTGSVISYKGEGLNLSVGSFSSSYNHASSGGAILSTNAFNLPKKTGSLTFGGAYFKNEAQDYDKSTGGVFGEYNFKRLKLNAQVAQSKFTNSDNYDTSVYFVPEFKLSNSLYLKTRFIRNVTQDTMQDELVLTYKPIKNNRNLEIELNATNQYTDNSTIKQRLKLSTSFRI